MHSQLIWSFTATPAMALAILQGWESQSTVYPWLCKHAHPWYRRRGVRARGLIKDQLYNFLGQDLWEIWSDFDPPTWSLFLLASDRWHSEMVDRRPESWIIAPQ